MIAIVEDIVVLFFDEFHSRVRSRYRSNLTPMVALREWLGSLS